jgi:signal transduction histidine kinase
LTARLSHDLRAPLRHVTSFATLIQDEAGPALNAEAQSFLGQIADSARHMGDMLDGLRELSRVGIVPLQFQSVPLLDLILEARQNPQIQSSVREVQWSLPADAPQLVTDAALLRQAMVQVLGNAIKFTSRCETPQISVEVAGSGADSSPIVITVLDNGAGYNPRQQAQLFKPFSRLHNTSQFPGLGMGLALTRKIMQRLGGEVTLQCNEGAGCSAVLTLPCAPT